MESNLTEIWKDIEGYEGLYQVSNLGRVKSLDRKEYFYRGDTPVERIRKGCILSPSSSCGYLHVNLHDGKKRKMKLIHRLVAQAFIPNPDILPEVNHKNELKTDNSVSNLEWCTAKYNSNYGTRTIRSTVSRYGTLS